MPFGRLTVALAQISPVWLDRERTLEKVAQWIDDAAEKGAQLVAFGETLVPGYPFWLARTGGAEFDSKLQKEIHSHYLSQAVDLDAGHLDLVCDRARRRGIYVMLGCFERAADRGGHTGYCSLVSIDSGGESRTSTEKSCRPTRSVSAGVWGTAMG